MATKKHGKSARAYAFANSATHHPGHVCATADDRFGHRHCFFLVRLLSIREPGVACELCEQCVELRLRFLALAFLSRGAAGCEQREQRLKATAAVALALRGEASVERQVELDLARLLVGASACMGKTART